MIVLLSIAIQQEKREFEMRHSISDFNRSDLRRSQTEVKNHLPSPEGNHGDEALDITLHSNTFYIYNYM
jgi:hypothetical protein